MCTAHVIRTESLRCVSFTTNYTSESRHFTFNITLTCRMHRYRRTQAYCGVAQPKEPVRDSLECEKGHICAYLS